MNSEAVSGNTSERKELGKIKSWHVGFHDFGYGVVYELGGDCWGVMNSKLFAADYRSTFSYSEQTWHQHIIDFALFERDTLRAAKKTRSSDLVGTPIEATFEGGVLKSWRVLAEVL